MSDQNIDIEKLIRLKRYEQPQDGYFVDFLKEFQSRQRSELLKQSARGLLFERVGTYFSGFSRRQWLYAGSAAYAAVTVGFFLIAGADRHPETQTPALSVASAVASAGVSESSPGEESHLWNFDKKIVLEVENDQIAERKKLTFVKPEWDFDPILPTAAFAPVKNYIPVTNGSDAADKEKRAAAPPVGRAL